MNYVVEAKKNSFFLIHLTLENHFYLESSS